ncbi:MAG: adenosylcobinamide-GDP ribazoletransferase [Actinomycetota bacterium]|nr:MAG: adenosylcobinamide-GDP [Actinomycetota bacterium]MDO8950887.1 adenosylcobinamide-GDP ribazoletransferase [Actinomycetota bacterium]MDP3630142.1 adenosylcobinamide-GDP ribazoletransferase [Actinomycetota bacterium]
MSVLRDIAAAISWMTVIAMPSGDDVRPVRWFPFVGWIFAGVALAIASAGTIIGDGFFGQFVIGWGIVGTWALVSRFLHWDGLSDTADAIWGAHDPARRLEIMRDSRTGSFGALAVTLIAVGQIIAVTAVFASGDWWALMAAPVLGRLASTAALWTIKPARAEGLAARLAGGEGVLAWVVALVVCAGLLIAPTPERLMLFALGLAVAILGPRVMARSVGGITGDILGASVLLVETTVLVGAALISGV